MNNLNILKKYFSPAGTAESEGNILDAAFIDVNDHLEIINPPYASPRLLIGKKGSGKSAFVRVFKSRMLSAGMPVLLLKPNDLDLNDLKPEDSLGQMVKKARVSLLRAIGIGIGTQLNGFLVTGTDSKLATFAVENGAKERDMLQKLHLVLTEIGKSATLVDFKSITNALQAISAKQIEDAIYQNIGKTKKAFFVLLDDTDQLAAPADKTHLNRIWAFLLATRTILDDCDGIRMIITLRREVWTRLQRDEAGQRDQVDHFRGLVHHLNPTEDHVKAILLRRLELAKHVLIENHLLNKLDQFSDEFAPFFEGSGVLLPYTNIHTSWCDLIVKRSRERPRDAIQLVAHLAKWADKSGRQKISENEVPFCLKIYSEERADDIKREADAECPQIKEIIRSFAKIEYTEGSFKANADQIQKHLLLLPNRFGIQLFGQSLNGGRHDHALLLWKYLFDIGFFGARSDDSSQPRGFDHTVAFESLDLISKERWNDMQKFIWEINPAYRDFLIAERPRLF
jgi:hypothetical protein